MKSRHFVFICVGLLFSVSKILGQVTSTPKPPKITIDTLRSLDDKDLVVLLNTIKYTDYPEYLSSANEAILQIWEQALSTGSPDPAKVMESINNYAYNNGQFEFASKLYEKKSDYKNVFKSPSDLLNYNLQYAISCNHIGMFHKSVTLLIKGIPKAEQFDSKEILGRYYDQLTHEYSYLTFEDSTLNLDFWKTNRKAIALVKKINNKYDESLQTIYAVDQVEGLDTCRTILQRAVKIVPNSNFLSQPHIDKIYYTYAWMIFKKGYYEEVIKTINNFRDASPYSQEANTYVILAQSYFKTGQIEKAREYAEKAKESYINSPDVDAKRVALYILPDLFQSLGNHQYAYYFSQQRNENLKQQFIQENLLNSEATKFNDELKEAIHATNHQKVLNTYLWLGLAVVVLVVVLTSISIKQIRSKNTLIKSTVDQLANTNAELHVANKDLESFAYASAHDIRNPLHTISGFLQLMKVDLENEFSSESQSYLDDIELSLDKINTLIQSILKYANVNENQKIDLQSVDLNELMRDVRTMLHSQITDNEGQIIIPEKLPTIEGVPELLSQVLLNIVSNAMKYRREEEAPKLTVTYTEEPSEYRINFKDNGIGIPDAEREKIFDLFSRAENSANYDGVGVGLAVTKKILSLHDGRIEVSNNSDHGSTFTIILPKRGHQNSKTQASRNLKPDAVIQ